MGIARVTCVCVCGAAVLALAPACGTESADPPGSTTTTTMASATVSDSGAPTTPTTAPTPGPPTLVTVDGNDLVAIALAGGSEVLLAKGTDMADSLELSVGRFDGVDLSADGTTVAFVFGAFEGDRGSYGLYVVPADGSEAPRRLPVDSGTGSFSRPHQSPDGRFIVVHADGHLVVVSTEDGAPAGPGLPMAYPPQHVTWSPTGDRLVWLNHYERASCCGQGSVDVDPTTGRIESEPTGAMTDGSPYFDPAGELRTVPAHEGYTTLDIDATTRFIVAVDETKPRGLVWWDVTATDRAPRRIGVDVDLPEAAPVAW